MDKARVLTGARFLTRKNKLQSTYHRASSKASTLLLERFLQKVVAQQKWIESTKRLNLRFRCRTQSKLDQQLYHFQCLLLSFSQAFQISIRWHSSKFQVSKHRKSRWNLTIPKYVVKWRTKSIQRNRWMPRVKVVSLSGLLWRLLALPRIQMKSVQALKVFSNLTSYQIRRWTRWKQRAVTKSVLMHTQQLKRSKPRPKS